MNKKYTLNINGKIVEHVGLRSIWDTVYFELMDQNKPGVTKQFGDFSCWWDIPLGGGRGGSNNSLLKFYVQDSRTSLGYVGHAPTYEFDLWPHRIRRKNELGEGYTVIRYDLSSYRLQQNLKSSYDRFEKQLREYRAICKKEYSKQRTATKKKELDEAIKKRGLSEKEYKRELAAQRAAESKKRSAEGSIERTKRILLLAPLLSTLKDEIDVVLKQYNDGRGNIGYPSNKIRKLQQAIRAVRSCRNK